MRSSIPLLDLHAHFPMHTEFPPRAPAGPPPVGKELLFWAANTLMNYRGGKPRVSLRALLEGQPGAISSVLYNADDEFFHGPEPRAEAFDNIITQVNNVENELAAVRDRVTIARNVGDLERCLRQGIRCVFHSMEGAHGLGGNAANVRVLAQRGLASMVVAHLFFRGVAACENALPFVPDAVFENFLNVKQPPGLTPLGVEIVEELCRQGVIPDITHATKGSQEEIFEIASGLRMPVISSHTGVRPTSDYPLNLSPETIKRVHASGGVVGIILSTHWLRQPSEQVFGTESIRILFRAIDCVRDITGGITAVAIGSDLDGFIHPIRECQTYADTPELAAAIESHYGRADAERILFANALESLARGWRGASSPAEHKESLLVPTNEPVIVPFSAMAKAMGMATEAIDRQMTVAPLSLQEQQRRAAAMAQIGAALKEMEAEADGIDDDLLVAPGHEVAAKVQSLLASGAHAQSVFAPLAAGGKELKFATNDALGWALSLLDWIRFDRHPQVPPQAGEVSAMPNKARIGILGDWGTGLYGAPRTADAVRTDPDPYFMLLHLGDVYYSGTVEEVKNRFLTPWPRRPEAINRAVNSNHEMYAGGFGYFDHTLPAFGQSSSYFAYQNDHWLALFLDTAYVDHALDDAQGKWIKERIAAAGQRKVALFSHHQLFSALDSEGKKLKAPLTDLLESRRIAAWYWGHEHRCVFYDAHPRWGLRARCIGHGGVPYKRSEVDDFVYQERRVHEGGSYGWRRIPEQVKAPACHVLDGPNPFITGREKKYGPHGYLNITFDGPDLVEQVMLPDGTEVPLPV